MAVMIRTFKPGSHFFRENDHSRELYIIQEGTVSVYRKIGPREVELAVLQKGSVLGEMALIDGKPRSASAKAVTEVSAIVIDADTFHNKVRGIPSWFMAIIRATSQNIRKANTRLQVAHAELHGARISITLFYLLGRFGRPDAAGQLTVPLTEMKKYLILFLGTTHQPIVRTLDQLHKHGYIELNETSIIVKNTAQLELFVFFLRLFMRKAYDKPLTVTEPIIKLMNAVVAARPGILQSPDASTEVPGADLWPVLGECGLAAIYDKAIEQLRERELVTVRKSDQAPQGDNPIAANSYVLPNAVWKKWFVYFSFHDKVPTV